jgi:hypothetical protein
MHSRLAPAVAAVLVTDVGFFAAPVIAQAAYNVSGWDSRRG